MRRTSGWATGGALAALVLLGPAGARAGSGPSTSDVTDKPSIVLPALPEAPVVVKPDDASPRPAASQKAQNVAPAATQPDASVAPKPSAPPPPLETALDRFIGADQGKTRAARETRLRRQAIGAFYASRAYAPLWLAHGDWSGAARAVVARLEQADDDGLDAADLAIPEPGPGDEAARDATELALTDAVVRYGEEASGGRLDPRVVSSQIADPHTRLEPAEILARIVGSSDPAQALDAFDPPQPGYRALRARLVELRAAHKDVSPVRVPPGRILRVGMRDARTPMIRRRLGLAPVFSAGERVYDAKVAAAVADFQRRAGLDPDGVLTSRTLAAMSGGRTAALEDEIIANMEFWRWAPRDMGVDRIEVNIPDYSLTLYHGDEAVRRARVVVGKAATPTPIFSNIVRYVVVNPSWVVPQSIVKNEMLPKLATDPNYFQEMGYIVTHKGDLLEVRQPPGDRNALGRIKFLFPNDYDVYLHDTPERALFNDSHRAFSHGCVRVQDPFALGQDVLGAANGWSEARLKKLIGDRERTIRVAKPLPIHIGYFTAFADAAGRLQLRPDIYGYERKVERALGLVG